MIKWVLEQQEVNTDTIDGESTQPLIPTYKADVDGGWLYLVFYPNYGPLLQFVPATYFASVTQSVVAPEPGKFIDIDPESPQFDFGFIKGKRLTSGEVLQNTASV